MMMMMMMMKKTKDKKLLPALKFFLTFNRARELQQHQWKQIHFLTTKKKGSSSSSMHLPSLWRELGYNRGKKTLLPRLYT